MQCSSLQFRTWSIDRLPGVSTEHQRKLQTLNIRTTSELLKSAGSPTARLHLAQRLQSHVKYVNKWTALARLAGIPSVGCQYCGLLLHAGISSPQQLAQVPASQLHRQLKRLQVQLMQRADLSPDISQISQWVMEAKKLCR